jgi:hypothetical protein
VLQRERRVAVFVKRRFGSRPLTRRRRFIRRLAGRI